VSVAKILVELLTLDAVELADSISELFKERDNTAEGFCLLGLVSWRLADNGKAIQLLTTAHELAPDCRDYVDALATIHTQVGNLSDGLYYAKLATALEPHEYIHPFLPPGLSNYFTALSSTSPSGHYVNGLVRYNQRQFEAAITELEAELELNNNHYECLTLYGKCLHELGRYDEAIIALQKATKIKPDGAEPFIEMGNSLYRLGLFKDAVTSHLTALELDRSIEICAAAADGVKYLGSEYESERNNLNSLTNEIFDEIEVYPPREPRGVKSNPDIIHIGYIINSIYQGDYYPLFEPILRHHDHTKFKVFVYQLSVTEDALFTLIKNHANSTRQVYDIDPETLAVIVRNDRLDAVVDLTGYSNGQQYTLLKQGITPVQIGHLRYPFGITSPGTNFVISDKTTAEMDQKEIPEGVKNIVMDHGLYAIDPLNNFPDPVSAPAVKNGFVTFGGKSDLATLTPNLARLWAEVLRAVPDSRLSLGGTAKQCDYAKTRIHEMFDNEGVADRVTILEPEQANPVTDVSFYNSIDIYLDSFPNSGSNIIIEALWMGIPAITLAGEQRSSLLAASILSAANKAEWISNSEDQYVELVVELSKDGKSLSKIRKSLRPELEESSLFDTAAHTRAWENAIESCIKQSEAG